MGIQEALRLVRLDIEYSYEVAEEIDFEYLDALETLVQFAESHL